MHHLSSVIDKIKQDFDKKNQKKLDKIEFKNVYKYTTLNILKGFKNKPKDEALAIIYNVIKKFSVLSNLTIHQIIELLLYKVERNFNTYGLIECFINDVMINKQVESDLIAYIEDKYKIILISDDL